MTRAASAVHSPRPNSRRLGQVAGACLIACAGMAAAQYFAGYFLLWSFGLPPRTATPLTVARYIHFYGDNPEVRRRAIICSTLGAGLVGIGVVVAMRPKPRPLHGEARLATRREIARAGLFSDHGIILGEYGRRYLVLPGQQGVAVAAPPRSGKGVGIVIPNLLHWPGSVVCIDVKKENWAITAGYRSSRGHEVHLYDPLAADGRTACSNSFSYVPNTPEGRIDGVQKIADRLFPEIPGIDPFWIASARSLFVGISLYLIETPSLPKTVGEVRRQGMASGDEGFARHWKRIVEGRQSGRHPLSPECVRALYDVIDLAPVTASSIRKTFTSRLDLWAHPLLDRATSSDSFDLRDLRKRPISIYVGVNPDDLGRLRPLLSLFFQQAIGLQTMQLPEHNPELRYPVLMLLDEFAALGRIPIMGEAISYLPGYNVRVLLVVQSPAQLREVYGPHVSETMLKSLAARVFFAPKDYSDAKEISDELGTMTVKARSLTRPRFARFGGNAFERGGNITVSEQRRPLLLPQEVKELGTDTELILYEGLRPIRAKKIRYYHDKRFRDRMLPPPCQASAPTMRVTEPEPVSRVADAASDMRALSGVHPASVEDIEHWESLTLEDFVENFEFESTHVPDDRPPNDTELQAMADEFLAALQRA